MRLTHFTKAMLFSALILLLLSQSSCKWIKEKGWFGGSKADTMLIWKARQDSLRRVDSLQRVKEQMMAREKARLDSIAQVEAERKAWEERFKYHIIVGSFITPEFAREHADFYRQKGYEVRILKGPANFELVSAEVLDNYKEAVNRLYQYQDTVEFEAWLYVGN